MNKTLEIKEPESKLKKFLIDVVDIIAFLVFIIWIFLTIKLFIIAPVVVKWHSMEPNFHPGEYIFIDKFYRKLTWWIKRWNVIVAMPEQANVSYLKRVIWLPWETIELKSWSVFLCKTTKKWKQYKWTDIRPNISYKDWKLICEQIKQPYIEWKTVNIIWYPQKITTTAKCGLSKFVLWTWQYLVFGDDRMYSTDSRCCFRWFCTGKHDIYYITKNEILGRVWWFKF